MLIIKTKFQSTEQTGVFVKFSLNENLSLAKVKFLHVHYTIQMLITKFQKQKKILELYRGYAAAVFMR